jgi:hypothetical protein
MGERKVPLITTPLPPFGKGDWGRGVVSKETLRNFKKSSIIRNNWNKK